MKNVLILKIVTVFFLISFLSCTSIVSVYALNIESFTSADSSGISKHSFSTTEDIYAQITTNGQPGTDDVDMYVTSTIPHSGDTLVDHSTDGVETVTVTAAATLFKIWGNPTNPGSWYIVIDRNQNGKYDANGDNIDVTVFTTGQCRITFTSSGLSIDATGNLVSFSVSGGSYSGATSPIGIAGDYIDVDIGATVTYSFVDPVTSSITNKRYHLNSITGPSSGFTVSSTTTITGTYGTQFRVIFDASANVKGDSSVTLVTVDAVGKTAAELPFTTGWKTSGVDSVTYAYVSPVASSSSPSTTRYVWASTSGLSQTLQSNTFTVSAAGTVLGTYGTQFNLKFNQVGLDSTAQGTIVSLTIGANPAVSVVYGDFVKDLGYVDAGATISYTFTSTVASSTVGKQFVLTTPAPTPAAGFSLSGPTTVTGTYKTQYDLKFDQVGLDGTAQGTIVSVTIGVNPVVNVVYSDFVKDLVR